MTVLAAMTVADEALSRARLALLRLAFLREGRLEEAARLEGLSNAPE